MSDNTLTSDEFVTIETITPERAAELLKRNEKNRPITRHRVEKIKRDLTANNWKLTPDGIGITKDGRLANGQHRCTAIVETGIPARTIVLYKMADSAMAVTDTGKSRSLSNTLALNGESNPTQLGSLLCFMVKQDAGLHYSHSAISNSEALDYLEAHPEARVYVNHAARLAKRIGIPSILAAGAAYWIIQRPGGNAQGYFDALINSADEPDWSAIHAVKKRMETVRSQRVRPINLVFLLVNGYNKWALGIPAQKLMLASKTGEVRIPEVIVP